jgi:ketosteroid isomerase-like protein
VRGRIRPDGGDIAREVYSGSTKSLMDTRRLLQDAFDALAKGDGSTFAGLWHDDLSFTIIGTTEWSKTYRGKESVLRDLIRPLFANFATKYSNSAQRILVDGDYAVVQCRGRVETKRGADYNNTYCYVIRMEDGKILEITEYMDTALAERVLTYSS